MPLLVGGDSSDFGDLGAEVDSSEIVDDSILNVDINSEAAIAQSKIAGLVAALAAKYSTGAAVKAAYEAEVSAFTDALFTKLGNIETSATGDQTGAEIKALYEAEANAFTDTLKSKLDAIETAATADQTGAEIKALYEAEANAFTDTLKSKLDAIETSATGDQTGAEIKTAYEAELKAFTDLQFDKLAAIATAATANQTDAVLKARANHTGSQVASTISDLATAVKLYRLGEFATPIVDIGMGTKKITGLGDPTAAQDAATKTYVDGLAGLFTKKTGSPTDNTASFSVTVDSREYYEIYLYVKANSQAAQDLQLQINGVSSANYAYIRFLQPNTSAVSNSDTEFELGGGLGTSILWQIVKITVLKRSGQDVLVNWQLWCGGDGNYTKLFFGGGTLNLTTDITSFKFIAVGTTFDSETKAIILQGDA